MPPIEEHVSRIVERLRKDHPDPAQREQLYEEDGRLDAYVATLMQGQDADEADVARIAKAVRAAEDGKPYHDA
ncbi:MAG TPA: hypothetical protein VMZ53_09700 [Kofleriaceae bacterium]|nr:hypothetical protein [Kofleriaceae bacterium]